MVDTGSPDTWVMGKGCGVGCEGSRLFDSKASKTFVASTRPYSIGYSLGTFKGFLASDTVSVANYSVPAQSIAIIDTSPDQGFLNPPGECSQCDAYMPVLTLALCDSLWPHGTYSRTNLDWRWYTFLRNSGAFRQTCFTRLYFQIESSKA